MVSYDVNYNDWPEAERIRMAEFHRIKSIIIKGRCPTCGFPLRKVTILGGKHCDSINDDVSTECSRDKNHFNVEGSYIYYRNI